MTNKILTKEFEGQLWIPASVYQAAVKHAVEAERKACAKLCEEGGKDESGRIHVQAIGCALEIRARGLR